ncbi:AbiH family protein [Enterococcus entomosocium]|uniref:AbiH family protein n=1 Tax=Enterococcus entomosocium TaxID=3034352 RepID=UPI003BD9D57A
MEMVEQTETIQVNNEAKNKIVIVGNGLDISIGLKSSYEQFIDYIKDRNHFIEDLELYEYNRLFLRRYENFKLNWSDFESLYEETVRKVNKRMSQPEDLHDSFEITVINDAIKKLEKDFYDYISDEYQRWLQQNTVVQNDSTFKKFSKKINPVIKELLSDDDTFFINFNYTETLEDIVEDVIFEKVQKDSSIDDKLKNRVANNQIRKAKNRIAHIHGSIDEDNILFGGGFADREDTANIHYSRSLLNDKLFRIKENNKLNITRKTIMEELNKKEDDFDLYIMGHSLQGSDFTFLSTILKNAKRVFIFYYENDYAAKMEELIKRLGSSIIEKVTLVPFVEILFEYKDVLINNYREYETILPFMENKFPNERILRNLSLTTWHFSFKHISELAITPKNINVVVELINKLYEKKVKISVKKLSFSGELEECAFENFNSSKAFIDLLGSVERVSFEKTGIDIGFLKILLDKSKRLSHLTLDDCTLLNNDYQEVDLSVCESLTRLEVRDCIFNPEDLEKSVTFGSSNAEHSVEKLVIDTNTNIIFDNSMFEQAKNLIDLSITLSDTDIHSIEGYLKNLEILFIDCSAASFPKLTVGDKIKEITIVGYPREQLKLSSILKNTEVSLGFPKFQILQLNSADNITDFSQIDIDVFLDIFSRNIKLILDGHNISIEEYYNTYKPHPSQTFLTKTKDIVRKTLLATFNNDIYASKNVLEEFKNWYDEISNLSFEEEDSKFLDFLEQRIATTYPKEVETVAPEIDSADTGKFAAKEASHKYGTTLESLKATDGNFLGRIDKKEKSSQYEDNHLIYGKNIGKHAIQETSENFKISKITNSIIDYSKRSITKSEVINLLKQKDKKEFIIDLYDKILNSITSPIDKEVVNNLKQQYFGNEVASILSEFSHEWCVSEEDLELSSMQYKKGMDTIPNLRKIIENKDFEEYKKKHPESNIFKYSQELKHNWQSVLENKLIYIKEELEA